MKPALHRITLTKSAPIVRPFVAPHPHLHRVTRVVSVVWGASLLTFLGRGILHAMAGQSVLFDLFIAWESIEQVCYAPHTAAMLIGYGRQIVGLFVTVTEAD